MKAIITVILCCTLLPTAVFAAKDEVGTVVALRGAAKIARSQGAIDARIKTPILLADSIATGEASRLKLLFIDDSVLTLAEKSRVVIKDFIHSKENRGQSIFNLLDGKMRAVVGKTKFQVQTPTAVAAARGTVIFFDVGEMNGKAFTKIVCLEGIVEVRSATGEVITLTPGMMVTVVAGEPMPAPVPVSPQELEQLKQATTTSDNDVSFPEPHLMANDAGLMIVEIPPVGTPIQVQQQPAVDQSRTATINISVQ